jgi:hypothetical protein
MTRRQKHFAGMTAWVIVPLTLAAGMADLALGAETPPAAVGDAPRPRAADRRVASGRDGAPTDPAEHAPLRLTAELLVEGRDGRLEPPPRRRVALPSGARYALRFASPEAVYVYAVQEDSEGHVARLFPDARDGTTGPARAGVEQRLPGDGRLYRLDDTVGRERIYVAATRSPARDLEDVITRFQRSGDTGASREMVLEIRTRGVAGVVGPDGSEPAAAPAEGSRADEDSALVVIEFEHVAHPQAAPAASGPARARRSR